MSNPHPASLTAISAAWSLDTMSPGAASTGALTLSTILSAASVSLTKGDIVRLSSVAAGWSKGWTFSADAPWLAVSNGDSLDLTWGGSSPFKIGDNPTTLGLTVTPSPTPLAPQFSLSVQIIKAGAAATTAPTVTFNLIAPQLPVAAFAQTGTPAILSAKGAIAFQNTLVFDLLNTQPASQTLKNAVIQLQLIAHGSGQVPPDLSQDVKAVAVTGVLAGETLVFSATKHGWSAPVQASSWPADAACTVTLSSLPLDDATITLLESQFLLTGIGTQPAYVTSAWVNAIGPVELVVALDTDYKESGGYHVGTITADILPITSVKPDDQPPINYSVTLDDGSEISTNLGYIAWSLSGTCGNFQIDKPLKVGDNPLYFLAAPDAPIAQVNIRLAHLSSDTPSPVDFLALDLSNGSAGADSPGKDLSDWKNLQQANFKNANLSYVCLEKTNVTEANLDGAILTGAKLSGVISSGLQGVPKALPDGWVCVCGYLLGTNVTITGANLSGANLNGVDLRGATLTQVMLSNVSLAGACLDGVDLTHVFLQLVTSGGVRGIPKALPAGFAVGNGYIVGPLLNLSKVDLGGANLRGVCLGSTNLSYANLAGADLTGATFSYGTMFGPDVCTTNLIGATLPSTWDRNGEFVSDGQYQYLVMDGVYRWIWGGAYNSLFPGRKAQPWKGTNPIGDCFGVMMPYLGNASLESDPRDGKVYLVTQFSKRWIADPDSFSFFGFDWGQVKAGDPATLDKLSTFNTPIQKDLPYTP